MQPPEDLRDLPVTRHRVGDPRGPDHPGVRRDEEDRRGENADVDLRDAQHRSVQTEVLDDFGATPKWRFAEKTVCGLKISANPTNTSRSCVAKSTTARKMFRFAASRMPTIFSNTSSVITIAPPTMSHGFVLRGSQKIER